MISNALFLGLAAVGLVSGQTYSKCNPIKQDGEHWAPPDTDADADAVAVAVAVTVTEFKDTR
jgi:hypothetical protein